MIGGFASKVKRPRTGSSATGRWQDVRRAAGRPRATSSESDGIGRSGEPAEASLRGFLDAHSRKGSVQLAPSASTVCPLAFIVHRHFGAQRISWEKKGGKGGRKSLRNAISLRCIDVSCEDLFVSVPAITVPKPPPLRSLTPLHPSRSPHAHATYPGLGGLGGLGGQGW